MLSRKIAMVCALVAALVVSSFSILAARSTSASEAAPAPRVGIITQGDVNAVRHALVTEASNESVPIADAARLGLSRLDAYEAGRPLPVAPVSDGKFAVRSVAPTDAAVQVAQAARNVAQPFYGPLPVRPVGLTGGAMALGAILGGIAGFALGMPIAGAFGIVAGCLVGLVYLIVGCPIGAIIGGVVGLVAGPIVFAVLGAVAGAMALSPVSAPVSTDPTARTIEKVVTDVTGPMLPPGQVANTVKTVRTGVWQATNAVDTGLRQATAAVDTTVHNVAAAADAAVKNATAQVSFAVNGFAGQFQPRLPARV